MTRSGSNLYFTGMNVHVRNGGGFTHSAPNGRGNLIVGYNEARSITVGPSLKTGSHNLIVGNDHNYTSTGGLVARSRNTISGFSSSIIGGHNNTASGFRSSISGGQSNTASNQYSSVSGGLNRTAAGFYNWRAGGLFQDQ